jgi:hypothetical protein
MNRTKASSAPALTEDEPQPTSWSVEEHPLSLSRYQREFDEIELLASGSFGHVYRVMHKMDGREYAVKHVSFAAAGYSREAVQQVVREVHCLAACDHPHVVRYYTSWLEPSWMTGSNTATATAESEAGNESTSDSPTSGEAENNKQEHLKLVSDIQRMISAGDGSGEELSNHLLSYFKDPSFGRATFGRSSSSSSCYDDDSISSWGNGLQERSDWTVEELLDNGGVVVSTATRLGIAGRL